jgi:hypothetical protein
VLSKNKKLKSKQQESTLTPPPLNSKNKVYLNLFCDSRESDDDDCVTINDLIFSLGNKLIIDTNDILKSLLDKRNTSLLIKEKKY